VIYLKKNYKQSLVTLIGGIGVIPILMAIFSESLSFEYAIVIGFVFFLISGTLNGLIVVTHEDEAPITLQRSQKQALVNLVGGIGVLVILMGIFSPNVEFGYMFVVAYVFFLLSGSLNALIEAPKHITKKDQVYQESTDNPSFLNHQSPKLAIKGYCSGCNSKIDSESIFCSHCGKDISKGF
jgi:hypothetical protein